METQEKILGAANYTIDTHGNFHKYIPQPGSSPEVTIFAFDRSLLVHTRNDQFIIDSEQLILPDIPKLNRNADCDEKYEQLNLRERKILDLLSSGDPANTQRLAEVLCINEHTLSNILTHIYRILELNGKDKKTQAAVYNLRRLSFLKYG